MAAAPCSTSALAPLRANWTVTPPAGARRRADARVYSTLPVAASVMSEIVAVHVAQPVAAIDACSDAAMTPTPAAVIVPSDANAAAGRPVSCTAANTGVVASAHVSLAAELHPGVEHSRTSWYCPRRGFEVGQ